MGTINWGRVVLGGLVAGLITNIGHGILWFAMKDNWVWVAQSKHIGMYEPGFSFPRPIFMAGYGVLLFVLGIVTIWLYAAIRPRYGAGPKTAITAGLAVWLLLALSDAAWVPMVHFSRRVAAESVVAYLVLIVVGALAGARLYHEEGTSQARSAGA